MCAWRFLDAPQTAGGERARECLSPRRATVWLCGQVRGSLCAASRLLRFSPLPPFFNRVFENASAPGRASGVELYIFLSFVFESNISCQSLRFGVKRPACSAARSGVVPAHPVPVGRCVWDAAVPSRGYRGWGSREGWMGGRVIGVAGMRAPPVCCGVVVWSRLNAAAAMVRDTD